MSRYFQPPYITSAGSSRRPWALAALTLGTVLALSACGKADDGQTVGQKVDAALQKTEQAAEQAKAKTETALANAGVAMKEATQKGEASGKEMVSKAEDKLDDLSITASVTAGLAKDADLSALKINVDTRNGVVMLKGSAPTAAAKERAAAIAKSTQGVSSVDNQLLVTAN